MAKKSCENSAWRKMSLDLPAGSKHELIEKKLNRFRFEANSRK